jgi:hypothetical protein
MNESPQSPALHIHLLGDFRLVYDSTPVTSVNTARLQSLLAYLVLHGNAPQARHYLAFLFWPDSTEAQAHNNLRNLLYHLRQALPEADRFLYADSQTLQWRAEAPFRLDVADFERAVAQAEQAGQTGDQAALSTALEEAVGLYGGDLLPSCYDDWILSERERLRQAFTEALERLILLLEDQRDYRAAIGSAQRLLRHRGWGWPPSRPWWDDMKSGRDCRPRGRRRRPEGRTLCWWREKRAWARRGWRQSTRAGHPLLSTGSRECATDLCQRRGNSICPAGFGPA